MKLFSYLNDGKPALGLQESAEGKAINFTKALDIYAKIVPGKLVPVDTIEALIKQTDNLLETVQAVVCFVQQHNLQAVLQISSKPQLLAPMRAPGKIICIGKNYVEHAKETGSEPPEEPIYFSKRPDCIIGTGEIVRFSESVGRVDPEVELAAIIGKTATAVHAEQAMDYVCGYTIINDVTARALQKADRNRNWPWFRAKNLDTFCPMGPYVTLLDEINDPHNLNLTLKVNGEIRQAENTSKMIFSIPQLIAHITQHMTLYPGDIIATGTPHGIAPLQNGDVMELEVEKIGILVNPVQTY